MGEHTVNSKMIVFTGSLNGFESELVHVECELSNGLPTITIVGLASKSVDEAKERVRSAMQNEGLSVPKKRITLNLAPADTPKNGSSFDLPLSISILLRSSQIQIDPSLYMFVGELSLSGSLRPIKGVLAHAQLAQRLGLKYLVVPSENALEASLINGVEVIAASNLRELIDILDGSTHPPLFDTWKQPESVANKNDFRHIRGQEQAKRAMQIVAAGGHNILLAGPPGTGKSMLAKALPSIMPAMSHKEVIEVTGLHSIAGIQSSGAIVSERPVRSPHHTASYVSMIGGGRNPQPGEISLSHRGILFLDELPEYPRHVLETLRQPLEDHHITVSRADTKVTYPARFTLVATQNPCPCGFYNDPDNECICTPHQINQYTQRISGPLMDRIDLNVHVARIDQSKILEQIESNTISSDEMKVAVHRARQIQKDRYGNDLLLNAHISNQDIIHKAHLSSDAKLFLDEAATKLKLSSRSYVKVAKISRTVADLDGSDAILASHVAEALQYRFKR